MCAACLWPLPLFSLVCLLFAFQYEQTEKKRREDREAKDRSRMMEKEGKAGPPSLRREFWYHPNNGQRVSRTTSNTLRADHSDTEEELAKLKNVDVCIY